MQLYNTLTKKLEEFTPQSPEQVSLYTCGPTVYDYPQIGNWIAYVRWDTLQRVLKENGYKINWVMNITDVGHLVSDADEGEDKLEKGARREGKTAWQIAKFYTEDFEKGLKELNIEQPTHLEPATRHIQAQIDLVKALQEKGYTYAIDDGVYFDTSKVNDYGKLARLNLDSLKEGARVEANPQKRQPSDFALWKFTPEGVKRDMEWDSPWGKGFPGWHIECSAIAMEFLGDTLDIHAGGIDHIPVHHTNEIAQSEAATGKPFAKYWLHGSFLNIDGSKISKSLGNSITLQDIIRQGFSPLDLRMLYLQSHYRTHSNFTLGGLKAAQQRRLGLQAFADLRYQLKDGGSVQAADFDQVRQVVLEELSDDLHTPQALAALSDLQNGADTGLIDPSAAESFVDFLKFLDRVLGLNLLESEDITDEQKRLIKDREQARANRDFASSDKLRDKLENQNLTVRDTPMGSIWQRAS
ncbi:MAG TPA: cysteine--tRNA ligase [Candidatus Saccharimonadales bacterium]|nr:cysteine--tRNA ligase [Candidatus Saccharimonadales bacterium]